MSTQVASTSSVSSASVESSRKSNLAGISLIVGIVGLVIAGIGFGIGFANHDNRYILSWLMGITYWLAVGLGMLMFVMIFYLFDAGWAVIIRRQMEHCLGVFKWLGLLFIPVLLVPFISDYPGLVWKWMDYSKVSDDALYLVKEPYLGTVFFAVRAVAFFAIWIGLAALFRKHSFEMDVDGEARHTLLLRKLAAAGIPLTALSLTFAAIDWMKSLEFHWFSTMYGVWYFSACMFASLAVTILIVRFQEKPGGTLAGIVKRSHYYLLGSLMLAFTVFWAYISFSQYFLIYNANIPEETFWYNIREVIVVDGEYRIGGWFWVSMGLIFLHFFAPFLLLLFYKNKFGCRIVGISVLFLIVHWLDMHWNIIPAKIYDESVETGYYIRSAIPSLFDFAAIIGVGGIFFWSYFSSAAKTKAIPVRDPRILESVNYSE